jgi:hypothetical protein
MARPGLRRPTHDVLARGSSPGHGSPRPVSSLITLYSYPISPPRRLPRSEQQHGRGEGGRECGRAINDGAAGKREARTNDSLLKRPSDELEPSSGSVCCRGQGVRAASAGVCTSPRFFSHLSCGLVLSVPFVHFYTWLSFEQGLVRGTRPLVRQHPGRPSGDPEDLWKTLVW